MSPLTLFAKLEKRLNASVFKWLSNATATFAGGEQVAGIFDEPYARGDVGMLSMADARPTFSLPTADIPAPVLNWFSAFIGGASALPDAEPGAVDLRLVVRGRSYQVAEHQPDGTGMSVLILSLEVAA
jgi:hypothetical protein